MSNIGISSLVLAIVVLQPPVPPHGPIPVPSSDLPVGALPWTLPQLPIINIQSAAGTVVFNEPDHSEDYDDNVTALENWFNVSGSQADIDIEVDNWFGEDGLLPDISEENFNTGISLPGYDDMTSYEIAAELGSNVGTVFSNIKALVTLLSVDEIGGAQIVIIVLVICLIWMVFVTITRFGIQLLVALWNVIAWLFGEFLKL